MFFPRPSRMEICWDHGKRFGAEKIVQSVLKGPEVKLDGVKADFVGSDRLLNCYVIFF